MLRNFRQTRQRLLRSGKAKKYLLYAIGEIILVVIGILIALQINTWNENKKQRKEEIRLLANFHRNLSDDIFRLHENIQKTQTRMQRIDSIFTMIHHPEDFPIQLFFDYQYSILYEDYFETNSGTFDEGYSSGKINFIQNDSLRAQIFEYYRDVQKNYNDDSKFKLLHEVIIPNWGEVMFESREVLSFMGFENSMPSLNLADLATNRKYNKVLAQKYGSCLVIIDSWNWYIEKAEFLKKDIESVIEDLKS